MSYNKDMRSSSSSCKLLAGQGAADYQQVERGDFRLLTLKLTFIDERIKMSVWLKLNMYGYIKQGGQLVQCVRSKSTMTNKY